MNSSSEAAHDYCSLSLIFVFFVLAASFIAKFLKVCLWRRTFLGTNCLLLIFIKLASSPRPHLAC